MTLPGFALSALLFTGVLWLFWWLVELTGGVAGHAFTVARSINAGVASWVVGRYGEHRDRRSAPRPRNASQAALEPGPGGLDGRDELTIEPTAVRPDRRPRA